jgi:hypothetical protein
MDLTSFPPVVRDLLSVERLPSLGPGHPNKSVRDQLQSLTVESLCAPHPVRRRDFAAACLAGLWLYHDFLDESHRISQDIHTVEGSYWHGIMHRREPDFSNAAYWFRKVGDHPIFGLLEVTAREMAPSGVAVPSPWDPFWFIDYCEACLKGRESGEDFARRVQKVEWWLLFTHCFRNAVGTSD